MYFLYAHTSPEYIITSDEIILDVLPWWQWRKRDPKCATLPLVKGKQSTMAPLTVMTLMESKIIVSFSRTVRVEQIEVRLFDTHKCSLHHSLSMGSPWPTLRMLLLASLSIAVGHQLDVSSRGRFLWDFSR